MKRKRIVKDAAVYEYLSSGLTLQEAGAKYGMEGSNFYRWVKAYRDKEKGLADTKRVEPNELTDLKKLQEELLKAQLHNKLLEAMIDVGKEQYGIDLRKKPGAKRS